MPMKDLVSRPDALLVWPRSNLSNFAYQMAAEQDINLMTFPNEWTTILEQGEAAMQQDAGKGGEFLGGKHDKTPRPITTATDEMKMDL